MINNNSKNIDKGKTEKLREMIIEDLKDCGGRISIIPLLGFNKWIEIIYLIKNDLNDVISSISSSCDFFY